MKKNKTKTNKLKHLEILPFYTFVYYKWRPYDIWFLRYGAGQAELFVIFGQFLPFYSTNNLKNQNFEK